MDSLSEVLERDYGISRNPGYDYSRCRWSGTGGTPCHECAAACPEGVFPDVKAKKPDYAKCSKCGLCAAVCPTRAIAPPELRVRSFLRALASDETLSVGCTCEEGRFSLHLDCLAALSWEEIACAALKNGLVLSLRPCGDCPEKERYARLLEALENARRFLGDKTFFERVQLLEAGDEYAPQSGRISRRELFSFYKKLDPERANRLLPEWDKKQNGPALIYRALLRDLVRDRRAAAEGEKPRYVVSLPSVNERCYDCGVCVRACPDRALSFRKSADGKSFRAVVEAWKCTACGRCAAACHEKAIPGIGDMQVTQLGPVSVGRCDVLLCSVCGKARRPSDEDGLCGFCRMRKKAAERAAEGSVSLT